MSEVRSMWKFLRDNIWLGIVTAITILALAAALIAIGGLGQVQDQREADRIADGVSGCQRGNNNRQDQAADLKNAIAGTVDAITTFTGVPAERAAALHQVVVDQLEEDVVPIVTDCSEVITGADPNVADFPP